MNMKKKALPLAVAAAMVPGFAAAADTSGYTDVIYTITDENAGVSQVANEDKFTASGEIDVSASPTDGATARVDVDLMLDPAGGGDSAVLEQAFFAWGAPANMTVIGGVFNNPIGYEAEDRPDRTFSTRGYVYSILDGQTALHGNTAAGLPRAARVGPATATIAYLNDLGQTNEENSVAVVINYSPLQGLDLELGFATQADQTQNAASAEDITDFNVVYMPSQVAGLSVGLDYLTTGKIVDAAYDLWAGYDFGNGFGVALRFSDVDYTTASANADADATSFQVSYQIASNLSTSLEMRSESPEGSADNDDLLLEFVATF